MSGAVPATTSSQGQPPARVVTGAPGPQFRPEPQLTAMIRFADGLVICGNELGPAVLRLRPASAGAGCCAAANALPPQTPILGALATGRTGRRKLALSSRVDWNWPGQSVARSGSPTRS